MESGSVKVPWVVIGVYLASLVAFGVSLLIRDHFPPVKTTPVLSTSSTNTPVVSDTAADIPVDWKTYRGADRDPTGFNLIQFTLRYPPDWVMAGNKWSFTNHGKSGWVVLNFGGTWGNGEKQLVREETRAYHHIPVTVTEYRRLKDNVIAGSYWFIGTYYGASIEAFGFAAEYDASLQDEFNRTFDQVLSSVRFLN